MGQPPEVKTFNSFDALKEGVAELLGSECYMFVFQGRHHQISAGPFHYLMTGDERRPLFDVPSPEEAEPAEHGYVGSLPPDEEFEEEEDVIDFPGSDSPAEESEEEEGEDDDPYGEEPEPDLQVHEPPPDDEEETPF